MPPHCSGKRRVGRKNTPPRPPHKRISGREAPPDVSGLRTSWSPKKPGAAFASGVPFRSRFFAQSSYQEGCCGAAECCTLSHPSPRFHRDLISPYKIREAGFLAEFAPRGRRDRISPCHAARDL